MSEEVVRLDFDAKRDGYMVQLSVVAYDEDFDTAAERAEEQLERYKNRLENSTPNEDIEAVIENNRQKYAPEWGDNSAQATAKDHVNDVLDELEELMEQ